jgi:hypothetical protein
MNNIFNQIVRVMPLSRIALWTLLLSLTAAEVRAQGSIPPSDPANNPEPTSSSGLTFAAGAFGDIGPSFHSAEFASLPGMISCQGDTILYAGSTGMRTAFGAAVGMMPTGMADGFASHIGWNVKLGLALTSGSFTAEERIGQALSPSGAVVPVISRYDVDASLMSIAIEPVVTYTVSSSTPLIFSVGPSLGVAVGASYDQSESVSSPSGAQFGDGRAVRNERSGDIEEKSGMVLGGLLGVGYDIALAPTVTLRPEITGLIDLTGPVSDIDWKSNALRIGVSLLFSSPRIESNPLGAGSR